MSNWIGPTDKQLWNNAMYVLHKFFGFNITQQLSANPTFIFYYKRAPWLASSSKKLEAREVHTGSNDEGSKDKIGRIYERGNEPIELVAWLF